MYEISKKEELLMEAIGYDEQEWGWVVDDFLEVQFELEANGIPTWDSLETFLQGKLKWINSIKSDNPQRVAA